MLKIEDALIESQFSIADEDTHTRLKVILSNNTSLHVEFTKEAGAEFFAEALEAMAKAIREKL